MLVKGIHIMSSLLGIDIVFDRRLHALTIGNHFFYSFLRAIKILISNMNCYFVVRKGVKRQVIINYSSGL